MAALLAAAVGSILLTPRPALLPAPCRCDMCVATPPLRFSADEPPGRAAALRALRWYKQTISPLLPPGCRFIPTCSEYAMQAFEEFSVPQAAVLTAWRLLRCNPTAGYGVDEPCWPPPAYWAGSRRVRTFVDDDASRARAGADEDDDGSSGAPSRIKL
ncbi:hypothetical protein AB1Y20_015238 [Prymnesium parvum]|uniref:Membrane protein insertion efficiency factor n=1 Tax=Prymnesium parvum TaxID=97485 RepID=A0AB34JW64_PRYPA